MGNLLDRVTGTRRPAAGVPPRAPERVRAALLALNRPELPYLVRDGEPDGVDLVAELKIDDEDWSGFFRRCGLATQFHTRMRLRPERHEVRSIDEQRQLRWELRLPVSGAGYRVDRTYRRGQLDSAQVLWALDDAGPRRASGWSSSVMKDALRGPVLDAGWTWRGVLFGRL